MTLSPAVATLLIFALLVAVAIACFVLGLYFGERGRRKDAQRREGVVHVPGDEAARAEVLGPDGQPYNSEVPGELGEAPDRFIRETMDETGCSEQEAQQEWRTLVARGMGDSAGGR